MRCTDLDENMNGTQTPRRRRQNVAQEKAIEEFSAQQMSENAKEEAAAPAAEPVIPQEKAEEPVKKAAPSIEPITFGETEWEDDFFASEPDERSKKSKSGKKNRKKKKISRKRQ